MASAPSRRVLIVANRTAATPRLLDHVKRVAHEQPSNFRLLIPDTAKSAQSDWAMELAIPLLERAAGGVVEALTGEGDPLLAIRRTLDEDHYDEIIISTLPTRVSKWLRRDLPRRVEALGVPVTVITAGEGDERLRDRMKTATWPTNTHWRE